MVDGLNFSPDTLQLERLLEPAVVIGEALVQGAGVRLGESAVLSTKVHAFNARSPECVQIITNADAGQVFYHRQDSGAICHLDTFHQCGIIDHRVVAEYVCQAIVFYNKQVTGQTEAPCRGLVSPDLIDIQTASGGGRITGMLTGGQKSSLRRVHENHVHLALCLPPQHAVCLFYIVAAVENAIINSGLELRCNERISCIDSTDHQVDLRPYTDHTDSMLTGQASSDKNFKIANESVTCSLQNETVLSSDQGNFPSPADRKQEDCVGKGQALISVKATNPEYDRPYDKETKRVSDSASQYGNFYAPGLSECLNHAIVKSKQCLSRNSRDIKGRSSGGKLTVGEDRAFVVGLDVAATVTAAATRMLADGGERRLRIIPSDIRFLTRRLWRGYDVCLLVDSSGSMSGPRLAAAKNLAGEILRGSCHKASVVTFQDNQAAVVKAFTTNRQDVLGVFETIMPYGATPLALGIRSSLAYLKYQQPEKLLLILMTDGIAGRKYEDTANPITDALAAAAEIKQLNCGFLCIGLDPDDGFLKKLTNTAGGVLYMFTNYEKQYIKTKIQR
ncbi:MAG: hypothetical protein K0R55_1216 [Sporomusa sp.]|nr:hypothetical protein [Sporomusa sp.]